MMEEKPVELTGTDLNYLHVCPRKLWLFRHGIRLEHENELVQLGALLGETSFSREEKEIPIGEAGVLDWADFKDGVIHETKHGKAPGGGDEAQVRYYLYYLNARGIRAHRAILHYPGKRETATVEWNETASQQVLSDLNACERLLAGPVPAAIRRSYCKRCAYEELCFL